MHHYSDAISFITSNGNSFPNGEAIIPNSGSSTAGLLSLSGTTEDFGTIAAGTLDIGGTAILAAGAQVAGEISVSTQGLLDFGGTLTASALSLASGAVLTGGGTLAAAGIAGPGTLLALGGETLSLTAQSISGGATLQAAGGGVLALGQGLTLDNSVTLSFQPGYGVAPVIAGYADILAQDGGVIVIDDPQNFNASITGFEPGDRLIFPGLTGLTLSSLTSQSFIISGDEGAAPVQFTLQAAIPAGTSLETGTDAAGDGQIGLSAATPEIVLDGNNFSAASINAGAGVGQALPGLKILVPDWTSQSLSLTLAASEGVLSDGSLTPGPTLVLNAASPAALNTLLAGLTYTAGLTATGDTLTVTSNTGILAGLNASAPIAIETAGTISGFAPAPTNEQTVLFTGSTASAALETLAAAPGAVIVSDAMDFADVLTAGGINGTALTVDDGGSAIFDTGAEVTLSGDAVIGDASGPGTLGIITPNFTIGTPGASANLVLGGNSAATGSAVQLTGTLTDNGAVLLGQAAPALLDISGTLAAAATTIGAAGTLTATGTADASFGVLVDSGTLSLTDAVQASAQQLLLAGQLNLTGNADLSGLSSAVIAAGGTLAVGQGATLSANGMEALGGAVLDQGSLLVAGNLLAANAITLAGGLLQAAAVTLSGSAILSGRGELAANGAAEKIALTGGEILATGGTLTLNGNVTMNSVSSIAIAGSSTLELLQATGGEILFTGTDAVLTLENPASISSTVSGMRPSDVIDLRGIAPSLVSDANGTITTAGGGSFALNTVPGQPAISILPDGTGGALITLGGEMACFVQGTRLLTPNGYVPVEAFKPGDPIITRLGVRRAVRWIGRRRMEAGLKARQDTRPVVVLPGALGPLRPGKPVRLSPSHAVFVDGVLVPVMHLVNGATILREKTLGAVTYFHIELDRHDVLMAEGLEVESYLDTGNRGKFHQEQGIRGTATRPYAPLVTNGPKLAFIRRRLHETALRAGFSLNHDPHLKGIIGETLLTPELRRSGAMRMARFLLPQDSGRLLLQARCAAPADTDPDSDDRRELTLCLRQPRAKQDHLILGNGWHPKAPGDAGIWMSGSAELFPPPGAKALTLRFSAVAQGWRHPTDG